LAVNRIKRVDSVVVRNVATSLCLIADIAAAGHGSEDEGDDDEDSETPSALALIVGITMAVVAIVIAGFLAAFCVRRNGTLRQGHQTLTSFENPIYDCENVLK
jgi:hypothetical protein